MQYSISINQKAFSENFPELDIIDAAIYDFIRSFMASKSISKVIESGDIYYWISYQKVIDELPMLGIKSKDAVYRRFKRLADADIIEFKKDNQSTGKSYFRQGKKFDIPVCFDTKVRMENRTPTDEKPYPPTDEKSDNHIYHNDQYTKQGAGVELDEKTEAEYRRYKQYMKKEKGRHIGLYQEEEQRLFLSKCRNPVSVIKNSIANGWMKLVEEETEEQPSPTYHNYL